MKSRRRNRSFPKNLRRILIIRFSAMGDVLLTTPLIRMLKNQHADSTIDFMVKNEYVSLLESNRHVDQVISFSSDGGWREMLRIVRTIRKRRFDALIDLQGNCRSFLLSLFSGARIRSRVRLNRWKRFVLVHFHRDTYQDTVPVAVKFIRAAPFPLLDDGSGVELEIPIRVKEKIKAEINKLGLKKTKKMIGLAPGAGRATKRWPAERFAEVGRLLARKRHSIFLIGGAGDMEICKAVGRCIEPSPGDFSGRLTLMETAALIQQMDLLITNDTGVMHLAEGVGTRILALFGPTVRPFGFFPFRNTSVVLEKRLKCRPCSYHGTGQCPQRHFRCMRDISSGDVLKQTLKLLDLR